MSPGVSRDALHVIPAPPPDLFEDVEKVGVPPTLDFSATTRVGSAGNTYYRPSRGPSGAGATGASPWSPLRRRSR